MTVTTDKLDTIQKVCVLLLFGALFFMFTPPLFDPDFWWHLASGKWMWAHGSLIHGDPFTIDSPFKEPSLSGSFILRQYWLSQLIFYGSYRFCGYLGVLLLGATVFTLLFYTQYRLMRGAGGSRAFSLLLMYAAIMVIVSEFGYIGTKPQMWSSLFAPVCICLLEALRSGKRWSYWAVPCLMLVWANLHGGFILGDLFIAIYLAGAVISRSASRTFVLVCLGAILLSGLNPNGFKAFVSAPLVGPLLASLHIPGLEQMSEGTESISETRSILQHSSVMGIWRRLPHFATLMLLSCASLILACLKPRRVRPEHLLLVILIVVMGLRSIRFIVFFAGIAPFLIVVNLRTFREGLSTFRPAIPRMLAGAVTLVISLALGYNFVATGYATTALGRGKLFTNECEKAADFIVEHDLSGNMFNDYNAGGYLIWRLSPKIKVFIDGRVLYGDIFTVYRSVVDNPYVRVPAMGNRYNYDVALEYFNIDMVLIPGCDAVSGTLIKLATALIDDPRWVLVHDDANNLFFVRDIPRFRELIATSALPKVRAYSNIYAIAMAASRSGHAAMMANWKLALAVAYAGAGETQQALRFVGEYLQKFPDDTYALELKQKLLAKTPASGP